MAGENDLLLSRTNTGNDLEIGRTSGDDRTLSVQATTGGATAAIRLGHRYILAVAATTAGATAYVRADYDPNLLSAVHAVTETRWQDATRAEAGRTDRFTAATPQYGEGLTRWQAAEPLPGGNVNRWQDSERLAGAGITAWNEGELAAGYALTRWQQAGFAAAAGLARWQDGRTESVSTVSRFRVSLPRLDLERRLVWGDGIITTHAYVERFTDGRLLIRALVEVWQQGRLVHNAPRYGPPIEPPPPYVWDGRLNLVCIREAGAVIRLNLGAPSCPYRPWRDIPLRRTYMSENSASLVRWPDLTPLPVTAMTVETTFDSWCWTLTATLAGPAAWALVQPNPLACEVQATINGTVWRFLLDVPGLDRSFNSNRITLKGRSRSAWLQDPYTPARDFSETFAREMQQLGEAALDNTGWTLDWQGENWVVPAGRYNSWNTPIGVLICLANVTNDGLYSHPWNTLITLQKRWPVASWLVDGESASIAVPEAALLNLTQQPVYTTPFNGVYVSGTSHGALALVKIAGTDGALQPAEPIVNELLCDEDGVAARQRGLNALSDSGAGWELTAETLFNPSANPAFPLVPPGQIVSLGGVKGVSRGCRITVQRTGAALSVRQIIGLERREVP